MKHNIGEIIQTKYGSYKIIDCYMKHRYGKESKKTTLYLCKCLIDESEFELASWDIERGANCPLCGRKRIMPGHSLYDLRPDLRCYYSNPNDAKNFAVTSSKKIRCICPNCQTEKDVIVENLTKVGFGCSACGDGVSYPNKFVNEFLNQLGVNHIMEKTFDWCSNRRYDQYLPDLNMIIENHGEQHFKQQSGKQFPHNHLNNQQQNDAYKKEIAFKNGIENYICIDCSISSIEWIRKQIMNSKLPTLLSFGENDIDWNKCGEVASSSLICKAWDLWNNGLTQYEIADKLNVCTETVRKYLNQGKECGKIEVHKNYNRLSAHYTCRNQQPIYCKTDNVYFASRYECGEYYKDLFPSIGTRLLYKNINEKKPYKGKDFMYVTQEVFNRKFNEAKVNKDIRIYGKPFRLTS